MSRELEKAHLLHTKKRFEFLLADDCAELKKEWFDLKVDQVEFYKHFEQIRSNMIQQLNETNIQLLKG